MDDLLAKINTAKNTPLIMLQCGTPPSIQEIANSWWQSLGEKMGFDGTTVKPAPNGDPLCFVATPNTGSEK
jgi:hypothetical protein